MLSNSTATQGFPNFPPIFRQHDNIWKNDLLHRVYLIIYLFFNETYNWQIKNDRKKCNYVYIINQQK